jgi:acetylornithine deacetylase
MTTTVEWLARLVAEPTVSAAPNRALVERIAADLTAQGAVCRVFPDAQGQKASLLARIGPEAPGGLMLSGHIDVVPVEGQDWTRPPFALTREGGRLYGRGTADMKGFVAAMLSLAGRVAAPARPLWLALSHDEEVGCVGVRPMLAAMAAEGLRPAIVVVGEPTSLRPGLGHKGKIALRLVAHGTPRHSAEAPLALNALHLAADVIAGLRALQDDLAAHGPREEGAVVPFSTVHVGRLTGGVAVNLVPAEAEMLVEARLAGGDSAQDILARITALAEAAAAPWRARFPQARVTVTETNRYPGLRTAGDDPAVAAFRACLPDGRDGITLDFGTEAGLFAQALGVPVVVCGPGDMAQGHRPDEFIEAAQLALCDTVLDRAVAQFCALPA